MSESENPFPVPVDPAPVGTTDAERDIYAAFERLIEQLPLQDLTVARLLEEADVSRATFYYYFGSKYDVLAALLVDTMDGVFETVQPFAGPVGDEHPEFALRRMLAETARLWSSRRAVIGAVSQHWHDVPQLQSKWAQIVERFVATGGAAIDRQRAEGHIAPGLPGRELASALFWATDRCMYVGGIRTDPDIVDEQAALRALEVIWVSTLYGRPPTPVQPPADA